MGIGKKFLDTWSVLGQIVFAVAFAAWMWVIMFATFILLFAVPLLGLGWVITKALEYT